MCNYCINKKSADKIESYKVLIEKESGGYKDIQFVQEVLAQITWYHNIT